MYPHQFLPDSRLRLGTPTLDGHSIKHYMHVSDSETASREPSHPPLNRQTCAPAIVHQPSVLLHVRAYVCCVRVVAHCNERGE